MNNKLRTAWTVAGIFAVLFIVMTVMWAQATGFFGNNLAAQREKVSEACKTADDLKSAACRDALDDLARLLSRFDRQLERMGGDTEATVNGSAGATVEFGQ